MKKLKLRTLLFLLIILTQNTYAQEEKPEFSINAELRTRTNILHGYKKLPTEESIANFLVEQRTRVGFAYKKEFLQLKITLQDARVWGDENLHTRTGIWADTASIDLKEAWANLSLNNYWDLKIGRQAFQLDEGRLVGYRNWSNISLSYDAALIKFAKNGFEMDVALSYNNSSMNLFAGEYDHLKIKSMDYIYLKKKFTSSLNASLTALFSGFQAENSATTIYFKTTVGPYIKFDNKKVFAKGEFYYQTGKTVDGVDVQAYFFNTDLGFYLGKVFLAAGIDYMSGQKTGTDINETMQAFDILYGARFKYYGNLNYVVTPSSTKFGGLMNPYIKLNYKFNKKNNIKLSYLLLSSAEEVANPNEQGVYYSKSLGSELDMIYTYKLAKDINIKAGYHLAFPTETMEVFKGLQPGTSRTPQWFWVMLTIKPTLFSSK
ncbi:MAG: alginate export family protein [Bacteroidales bacterium]|nr:alginate export family protein [Bacteroidales bacterium]